MELREFVETDNQSTAADGVIQNVLVLGATSRNRRQYQKAAMQKAVPLYEGVAVYVDHPTQLDRDRKGRSAADRFGTLKNVRFIESAAGPQIRGDLLHLNTHPLAPRVAEDRQRDLKFFGLSHLADGTGRTKEGIIMVESIDKVTEVDLVTNPATALSLMEQEAVVEVARDEPTKEQQDKEEAERQADYALQAGVMAILKDPETSLADKETKIIAMFKAHLAITGEAVEPKPEEKAEEKAVANPEAEEKAEEKAVAEQTATLAKSIESLTEQVAALKGEVAELKKRPRKYLAEPSTQPPAPAVQLAEQTRDRGPAESDPKTLGRWLKSR